MSPSTPTRASRTAEQDESQELESFDNLASSQPISLSQLCARASSRLRVGRSSKRLHLEDPKESEKGTHISRTTGLCSTGKPRHISRLSTFHQASTLIPSRFYSEMQDKDNRKFDQEGPWYDHGVPHSHRNPLSYSCDYDSPFAPFARDINHHPGYGTWPARKTYENFSVATPAKPYLSDLLAESSLSLYRESFDRPSNQSPYESLRSQPSGHKHPNIRNITASMQTSSADVHIERRKMASTSTGYDTVCRNVPREGLPGLRYDISYSEGRPCTPASSPSQTARHGRPGAQISELYEGRVPKEVRKRSNKEEVTAYLRAIVESSHLAAETTEMRSLSRYSETPLSEERHYLGSSVEKGGSRNRFTGVGNKTKHSTSIVCNSPQVEAHGRSSRSKPDVPQHTVAGYLYEDILKKMAKTDPVVRNTPMGLSYLGRSPSSEQTRLNEANAWFSADHRGKEQLRSKEIAILH
ncbi:hypothetical protein BDV59DRAFT_193482 [Aspergillus ambiguus]|uniref:uncharacterized protein n=1 Tax=Aspergillus ambiguus TaxID=176160 RepID=UPI003CCD46B6